MAIQRTIGSVMVMRRLRDEIVAAHDLLFWFFMRIAAEPPVLSPTHLTKEAFQHLPKRAGKCTQPFLFVCACTGSGPRGIFLPYALSSCVWPFLPGSSLLFKYYIPAYMSGS